MQITNVIKQQTPVKQAPPEKGYYAKLHWMWGDADGYDDTIVGPFPDDRKDLFIEFLNVIEEMFLLYHKKGKDGYDGYETVPGFDKWFSEEGPDEDDEEAFENNADAVICSYVGAEVPDTAYSSGCVPELTGWKACWYDGVTMDEYPVKVVDGTGAEIDRATQCDI